MQNSKPPLNPKQIREILNEAAENAASPDQRQRIHTLLQYFDALLERQTENQIVLETMTEGLVIQDQNGRIEKFNPSALSILGLSEEQLLGRTSMDPRWKATKEDGTPFPGEEHPGMIALKSGKGVKNTIMHLTLPSEVKRSIKINAIPFEEANQRKVACTFSDITDQKRTERQFIEAQGIAKIGSWNFDPKSQHLSWSPEHYKIFEIAEPQPPEKLLQLYRERVHPDDRPELDRLATRSAIHGEDFTYEHRVYLNEGKRIKFVRGVGKVTKDAAGKPIFISGTCQDVTDHVRDEEEKAFVLDALQIGVWKFNPTTQSLHWDKSMYDLYDIRAEDFSGHYQAWESTLTPESKARAVQELEQAVRGEKEFNTVFEIQTRTKGTRYIAARAKAIRDREGVPLMMYGVNIDVTEQRRNELEKEKLTKLLDAVLQNVPSMIVVKDFTNDLRITMLNRAGEALLGIRQADIVGKSDHDLLPREVADSIRDRDLEVFRNQKSLKLDQEEIDTYHGKRLVQSYKVPTYTPEGTPDLLIGVSTDITDDVARRHALELEKSKSLHSAKLASLGEMSAGIAHEINNPLAIICCGLTLLKGIREKAESFDAKIDTLTKAAGRIEKIVKGLKKFSRSSGDALHKSQNLAEIISEALTLIESKARRYSVSLSTHIDSEPQISADAVEIEQVLINLISNAIDAARDQPDGWVRIRCFDSEGIPTIQVIDSGQGITSATEAKLFQPFFTTKPVGEGTGLGLSIVKGILDQHRATISLNRSMKNTCFEIQFQRPKADANSA